MTASGSTNSYRPLYLIACVACAGLMVMAALTGCGGTTMQDCTVTALNISPASATASHTAAAPGNQAVFIAFDAINKLPAGCVALGTGTQAQRVDVKWTVSDTANVKIGNTVGADYGIATCVNAAPSPVTVTASGPNGKGVTITGTSTLTCN
jgi:hypothetical protein